MFTAFIFRGLGWIHNAVSAKVQDALLAVLSSGPIPQHVAFVMDGNRRYARRNNKVVWQGHADGFEALRRVSVLSFYPTPLGLMLTA